MSAGRFLARWSRLKRTEPAPAAPPQPVAAGEAAPLADAPPVAAPAAADALPAPETLTLASDFTAFLKAEVAESLRREALKKLFADPHFNVMDGLDVYIDDYSVAAPIPPEVLAQLRHARELLDDDEEAAASPVAVAARGGDELGLEARPAGEGAPPPRAPDGPAADAAPPPAQADADAGGAPGSR